MVPVMGRRTWWLALSVCACGLLVLLVRQVGVRVLLEQCVTLGNVLPPILALTFLKFPLEATAWRLVLPPEQRPPWWRAVRATIGGEAIGFVTLAGPVTAGPTRAALLKQFVPLSTGIAAGVAERSVYASTGMLVVALALSTAAWHLGRGVSGPALAAIIVAAAPVAVVLLAKRHAYRRFAGDSTGWREVLRGLWWDRRRTLHVIALLGLAQQLIMIGEAYLMLHALGAHPTFATVLTFEGMSKVANSAGAIVPGRLGIAEGSSAAFAAALGLGSSVGISLVLMRRVRGLLWSIVGLTLVVPELWRR